MLYGSRVVATWRLGSGFARLELRPLTWTIRHHNILQRLSGLRPQTNYQKVHHYKQTSPVNLMLEAKWALPQMWLQLTEGISKHAKGNDDWEVIMTGGQKSSLKRLSHIKGRREKRNGILPFQILTGSWGYGIPLTSTPMSKEENQWIACIATFSSIAKYSVVPIAQGL